MALLFILFYSGIFFSSPSSDARGTVWRNFFNRNTPIRTVATIFLLNWKIALLAAKQQSSRCESIRLTDNTASSGSTRHITDLMHTIELLLHFPRYCNSTIIAWLHPPLVPYQTQPNRFRIFLRYPERVNVYYCNNERTSGR